MPSFVFNRYKIGPQRTVGQQAMPAQIIGKQLFAVGQTFGFGHFVQTGPFPGLFGGFYNKSAGVAVKGIAMGLK